MKNANEPTVIVPDTESDANKKQQVAGMFDKIAAKYDFLNHFLSMGIDRTWRKKAIQSLSTCQPKYILDVATGTGDLAIAAAKLQPQRIEGIDISKGMLELGKKKISDLQLQDTINLQVGDSEAIPFDTDAFDAVTCAYGVRNFENLQKGLSEMHRVLRPGGKMAILEFSKPKAFPFKQLYNFYFLSILPTIGKLFSKDQKAYTYLPNSVMAFPDGKDFTDILQRLGFKDVKAQPLTFGITTLYTATK